MSTSKTASIFVEPEKVILRLQVNPEIEGIQQVVISAIVGAQLHLSAVLDTHLPKKTWASAFFLDSSAFSGIQPGGTFRLELPSGFVREDSPVSLQVDNSWNMAAPTSIPSTDFHVDYIRGIVYVDASLYADRYVKVAFTAGFESGDPEDLISTPPEAIPDWLEEAIISYTGVVLDVSQTTSTSPEANEQYKRAGDHAMVIIQPYLRHGGLHLRPIIT